MRIFSMKRQGRIRRLLILAAIFSLIMIRIRLKDRLWYGRRYGDRRVTIKRYEIYKYVVQNFTAGAFLKNRTPGNTSYCNFRLGDSESFNYTDEDVSYSPELGEKGPYRVLYGVVRGVNFNSSETNTVTYATHGTLDFLLHIAEIAKRWEGPISVSCFLPGTDSILGLKVLEKLCFCVPEMANVNIHFVYHKSFPPQQMSLKNYSVWLDIDELNESSWKLVSSAVFDYSTMGLPVNSSASKNTSSTTTTSSTSTPRPQTCYVPKNVLENSYRKKMNLVYPINVARNAARYASKSKYVLVSDIELFPSQNLVSEFMKMTQTLKKKEKGMGDHYFTRKKHVFVLPVFEVEADLPDVPRTKTELLYLINRKKAVYFHNFICSHCQRFPGIQKWLQIKAPPRYPPNSIQPLVVVKREFPYHRWEPVYIGTNDEPLYSELLTWEGQQDKMTQMHEMCLLEYRFVILNGAFLVHTPGIKRKKVTFYNKYLVNGIPHRFPNQSNAALPPNFIQTTSEPTTEWRNAHIRRNSYLYQIITKDVMERHKYNKKCKLH